MALTDKITAVAEAIRSKTGKTDKLTLDQIPAEIESISGGGGDAPEHYTAYEFNSSEEMTGIKVCGMGGRS